MKKFLIGIGFVATSLINSTTNEGAMAGAEFQRLIECSARDAALQAEMEIKATLLDAIDGLNQRIKDTEENLRTVSTWTKSPSMTAAEQSDMTAAQIRIDELEKCCKDLQTCVNALAANADRNSVQASTTAELNTQVKDLEASQALITAELNTQVQKLEASQASTTAELNAQVQELEASQALITAELNAQVQKLEASQALTTAELNTQVKGLEASQSSTTAELNAQLQELKASQALITAELNTQVKGLEASHTLTTAELNAQVQELEASVNTLAANIMQKSIGQVSNIDHLNIRLGQVENQLNGTLESFKQGMHELQDKMKMADANIATTNANITALKKDVRRRM